MHGAVVARAAIRPRFFVGGQLKGGCRNEFRSHSESV